MMTVVNSPLVTPAIVIKIARIKRMNAAILKNMNGPDLSVLRILLGYRKVATPVAATIRYVPGCIRVKIEPASDEYFQPTLSSRSAPNRKIDPAAITNKR